MLQKQIKLLTMFLLVVILIMASGCSNSKSSEFAAKVNDNYITKKLLDKRTAIVSTYYEQTARKLSKEELRGLRQETLGKLVYESIIAQEAEKKGILVADAQINDFISQKRKSLDNDENNFQSYLNEQGYKTEANYREIVKSKLLTKALMENVAKDEKDPLKKKAAFDKFMNLTIQNYSVDIYENFEDKNGK